MTNDDLRDQVLAALDQLPVTSRRLFGGYGLYLNGAFFAVISDSRLYFRTDDESRATYLANGMAPLQPRHRPRGPRTVDRNFEVPAEVRADREELRAWALRAAVILER